MQRSDFVNFELKLGKYFLEQCLELSISDREKIQKRLILLKENPFRNKSIYSQRFNRLFRVRIELEKTAKRIIYVVIGDKIFVAGFTDRDKDYSDLDKLLQKLEQELDSYK